MNCENYSVYWIKDKNHTNVNTEGYVGITKRNPLIRLKEHKSCYDWAKSQDIVLEVLHSNVSKDFAQNIENTLRPSMNIGWNYAEGGGKFSRNCVNADRDRSKMGKFERTPLMRKEHSERMKTLILENPLFKVSQSLGGKNSQAIKIECSCGRKITRANIDRHLIANNLHYRKI